jgi:hypothetical protein
MEVAALLMKLLMVVPAARAADRVLLIFLSLAIPLQPLGEPTTGIVIMFIVAL